MSPVWEIHFKLLFYNCQSESEQELESTSWNPSYIPSGSENVFFILDTTQYGRTTFFLLPNG